MSSEIDTLKLELQPFIKRSVTTGPGNAPGTTLVDATLVEAVNFWNGSWLLLRTGTHAGQVRRVTAFAAGTVTLDHTVGGQIIAGAQYVMLLRIPVDIIAGGGLKADLRQVLGQGADIAPGNELLTEDTGLNTNPERWMQDHHWECDQVTVTPAGAPGQQNLGVVVPAGVTRRIRVLHVRHAGTNNTVVTLLIAGGAVKRSWDIPAQTTRVIPSEDGWSFTAGQQPAVQTSDVTGGSTYVGAEGVQA